MSQLGYQAPAPPGSQKPDARMPTAGSAPRGELPAAYAVTGEQVREWAFLGWCALIDADKYLRRDSLWEAHSRLHEARHHLWALWAAAHGALYPWHGLSQVFDHDPRGTCRRASSPPSPASTQPACAAPRGPAPEYSPRVSASAARRHPADLPAAMAAYVTRALSREP